MQLIMRKHWKLWVVGNHVDHCNLNIQKKIVAAQTACVWRIGIGRDVLVLLANFTIKFYKGCLRCSAVCDWHDKAGAEKGRLMRKVYCALCKDEAVVCSLV